MQFHAGHIAVFVFARFTDTHVPGGNAFNSAIFVIEHFSGSEPRVDLDTKPFGLFCQPTAHISHGDDEVTLVMHRLGYEKAGHLDCGFFARVEEKCIPCDFGI